MTATRRRPSTDLDLTDKTLDGQVRSRDRVRDLAEVFTHQREVDAILDQFPDAFTTLDAKFLEPACGSGNFLVEILRRKLVLVDQDAQHAEYEHQLLRAVASIYGVDISPSNVTEARDRMLTTLTQAHARDLSTGLLSAAGLIVDCNVVVGDTLTGADRIELCDWQPRPGQRFQRVWSYALVPPVDRDLFWGERVADHEPVHYRDLAPAAVRSDPVRLTR